MSSNTRGGWMWPSDVAKGRSQIEAVTAGVDEGAGGQMGLAKTLGEDEGGSEIKADAGVDDTGMGITGLWAESFTVMSSFEGAVVDPNFCMNALLKLNPPDVVACCYYSHLWTQLLQPPNWSACFFPPSRLRSPCMKIHHVNLQIYKKIDSGYLNVYI